MRYGRTILVSFFILVLNGYAFTQVFNTYTIRDGMVSNFVRRIFQDSRGFLWIATWEGLSRYNGHTFTNYTTTNGLSHDLVNDLFEINGKLYIACNDGSIDIFKGDTITKAFSNTVVNRFRSLHGKLMLPTDHNGIIELKQQKLVKHQQYSPTASYYDITTLNDSLFVAGSDEAFHILDNQFRLYSQKSAPESIVMESVFTDSKKRTWVGTNAGLKLLSNTQQKNDQVKFASLPPAFNIPLLLQSQIRDIYEEPDGTMWLATVNGLVKLNTDGTHQVFNEKNGLPSDYISCIYQDREKNIWIGTNLGLAKLVTKTSITIYTTENGLASNDVAFLHPFKPNHLIVSSGHSFQVYNTSSHKFSIAANPRFYIFNQVQQHEPMLLISEKELLRFDTGTHSLSKATTSPGNISIGSAVRDRNGNVLIGGSTGIIVMSGKPFRLSIFNNVRIDNLMIDHTGFLWVGTFDHGLYRIKYEDKGNEIVVSQTDRVLEARHIRALFEDSKGNIWIGTRYNGAYLLRNKDNGVQIIANFHQGNGLTSNWIRCITEDAKGAIWLAFYLGLDKLIPRDTSYQVFNFSRINNFFANIQHIAIDRNNQLWLATVRGMVQIKDGELERTAPGPAYITSVRVEDSLVRYNGNDDKELTLSYKLDQLRFEFASPGFINEKQILYSYRLTGASNSTWSQPSNQQQVSYASLKPGTYQFEVRTLGWNGDWGDISSFKFTIRPPFWQTAWFVVSCSLVIIVVCWWLIRKRLSQIRQESEMKQKIVETEMIALRAQMNPHFIFNCLNSIDNLIQNGEKEKATTYLAKFARLLRAILENSKTNIIPCWKDLETLQLYLELEEFRCDKKFTYRLNVDPGILQGDYKVPPLIIQPYVENAILHGLLNKEKGERHLAVTVKAGNNHIHYVIEDTGIGRKKAAEYRQLNKPAHQSMGLDITRSRIDLFNQKEKGSITITDLYDENNASAGTRVEVNLINQS
jgi:ligand-binding sensor domain-containing protein